MTAIAEAICFVEGHDHIRRRLPIPSCVQSRNVAAKVLGLIRSRAHTTALLPDADRELLASQRADYGAWLAAELKARKLSQRELAEAAGVDHTTICRLVRSGRQPMFETAQRISRALTASRRPPMTDRTVPADPREALREQIGLLTDVERVIDYIDPKGNPIPTVDQALEAAHRLAATLAARQDEPSPALREALARAIEGGYADDTIDEALYLNDPVYHAVVYEVRQHRLAANPPQTREAEA